MIVIPKAEPGRLPVWVLSFPVLAQEAKPQPKLTLISNVSIYASGAIISQTSGHADWMTGPEHTSSSAGNMERLNISVTADGIAEVRKAVRRNFAFQASHIKICTGGGISSILRFFLGFVATPPVKLAPSAS